MITITDHSVDSISSFDLEKFCENLSPIGLDRLKNALFFEQRERDKRERFNKAKEKVIKSLSDFQDVIDEEGGDSDCLFHLSSDLSANFAGLKEIINNWTLEDFKD